MARRWLASCGALCFLPLLTASNCGPKPPTEPTDEVVDVPTYDEALALVALQPSTVVENTALTADLIGSGFVDGLRVWVGARELDGVTVRSDDRVGLTIPGLASGSYDIEVVHPDGSNATLRSALRVTEDLSASCEDLTVYFEVDSSVLSSDATASLSTTVECLKAAKATVRIEGHCDERGTTDYNLALGQRRADAVSRWLSSQGVPTRRLSTISYGEERPAAQGSSQAVWAKNRRVELALQR
ncbi:MAG: OmpA family protein [Myxococcota bacterium]